MRRKILQRDRLATSQYIPRKVALSMAFTRAAVRAGISATRHRLSDALPWLLAAGAAEAGAGGRTAELLSSGAEDCRPGENHCEAARKGIDRDGSG